METYIWNHDFPYFPQIGQTIGDLFGNMEDGAFGNQGGPQPPEDGRGRNQPQMTCPYCRQKFQLPPGGVTQLRTCGSEYYDNVRNYF